MDLHQHKLAKTIDSIGKEAFAVNLLSLVSHISVVDHVAVIHLGENDTVYHVCSANRPGFELDRLGQKLYFTLYFREDPNREWLGRLSIDHPMGVVRLQPGDIANKDYQNLWYNAMDIKDRLSLITLSESGLHCCNLYRMTEPFSDEEFAEYRAHAEVICALAAKHTKLTGMITGLQSRRSQIVDLEERLGHLPQGLTQREIQVCARILLGMTTDGIALDLDIKPHTVVTYRKRAYLRLQISSQNELFALCLVGPSL